MKLMASIRQHVLFNRTLHSCAITYSILRRTYSLLCQRPPGPKSSILASSRIKPDRLHCDQLSCISSAESYSAPHGASWQTLSTDSVGCNCPANATRRCYCTTTTTTTTTTSESIAASHQPKREGELLKYTSLLRSPKQRFVLTPGLAKTVRKLVWPGDSLKDETATIISANEGPGFMSEELLTSGASKVLALCRHEQFGPALEELRSRTELDSLQWQHADLYQMQYIGDREIKAPVARIEDVFQDIDPVPWEEDIGVKVVGALPQDGERKHAYVLASLILERLSMFSYGRVQLNLFMSENCYSTLIHPPGHMKNYRALSALYQVSCDVKLLHTEPLESFKLPRKTKPKPKDNEDSKKKLGDLLLVQITPKQDLFTRHQLEQWEAFIFVFFIRQALARRKEKLRKVIDVWAPGSGDVISEFGYNSRTATGEVSGDHLLAIFCRICKQDNFNGAWMGEEVMGWASGGRPIDMNTMELSQALGSMNLK